MAVPVSSASKSTAGRRADGFGPSRGGSRRWPGTRSTESWAPKPRDMPGSGRRKATTPSWPTGSSMTEVLQGSGAETEPICRPGNSPRSYDVLFQCFLRSQLCPRSSVCREQCQDWMEGSSPTPHLRQGPTSKPLGYSSELKNREASAFSRSTAAWTRASSRPSAMILSRGSVPE